MYLMRCRKATNEASIQSIGIWEPITKLAVDMGESQSGHIIEVPSFCADSTIIFTALPTISNDLGGQAQYILVRQRLLLFALGSGIAGGANTSSMFISGRFVQGLGGGGMVMLMDLIVCDLLLLRERSTYLRTMLGRWAFWINLPAYALTLAIMIPFLRLSWKRSPSWVNASLRIDYVGNVVFIGSVTAILIGLVQGGVNFCTEPTMPLSLFAHRTSATVYLQNFIVSVVLEWAIYILPLYFQSQLSASALTSGLDILPINAFIIPSGAVTGAILTKIGRYKSLHWGGFGVLAISCGLFSTMSASTSTVAWAWFEILAGIGIDFLLTTQLPAVQAVHRESDTTISTSTYSFVRSFGFVWGATIPSIVFNSRIDALLGSINDTSIRAALANGGAYNYTLSVRELNGQVLDQTLKVYKEALRIVRFVGLAFALMGFLMVFAEKHVDMRAVTYSTGLPLLLPPYHVLKLSKHAI
ncbi:MFS general substrate transporter [Daldinia eschscholtzii]|nr:MFS general substrate transporter [Daldinia eschscholtzii]